MKKLILILTLAGIIDVSAQEDRMHSTTQEFTNQIPNDPLFESNRIALENFTRQYIRNAQVQRGGSRQLYVIPVVFHILHFYGPENVTDSIIKQNLASLSNDFRKWNADTVDIVPSFQSIAADCEIEFRLAQLDPNGNCTNGIEHIVTTRTYFADANSYINPWPNNQYLNFWIVNSLEAVGAGVIVSPPGSPPSKDGVMIQYDFLDGSNYHRRSITHEMGHYFNLNHPWGNTNIVGFTCGDDSISDTPETMGWDHCDLTGSICNPPVIENVQNFMEFSYCTNMFTHEQALRMQAALNSPVNGRDNLWKPANLFATGTDGSQTIICSPIADFIATPANVCVGDTVFFHDQSWNATDTSWLWTFPGGNPASSTDKNPAVGYSSPGIYNASLIVSNSQGIDSITRIFYVRVSDTAIYSMPFTEDFESVTSFPGLDGWMENRDDSVEWSHVSNANSTTGGSQSIMINNFNNPIREVDSWISPSINFSNVNFPITFSFNVSYAQQSNTSEDQLRIFYSTDCGATWANTTYSKTGSALSTAGTVATNFIPTTLSQWRTEQFSLNAVHNMPNVRFKFESTSDNGNNIYIDDINITGNMVGISDADDLENNFSIFPNPSNGESTINFNLNKSSRVSIELKNVLGQTVKTVLDQNLGAGNHSNKLSVVAAGIYLVDVIVDGKHHVRKLVVV